jgi:hypothetical protein
MAKKMFAVIALAILAIFAVPAAANAAGYVPQDSITVSGASAAGATVTVTFGHGAFGHGADVTFGVTGAGKPATLSVFKAATATLVNTADANGNVNLNVTLPTDASGSYTITGTDTFGTVGTATLTVPTADGGLANTGGKLAHTGYDAPMLLIWGAAGALLLGVALVVVLGIVRRQRASA